MSTMHVYGDTSSENPEILTDKKAMAEMLRAIGIQYQQWSCEGELATDATQEEVLAAYGEQVKRVQAEGSFETADVIGLTPDHPDKGAMREKFLSEHRHSDDEVRFFIEGAGLFYLHIDERVYGVLCTAGDYISIPANTPHWFDMGPEPAFRCIRFFTDPAGWVAQYTGSDIAEQYPRFE